jgi:predicted transcriptional regulator
MTDLDGRHRVQGLVTRPAVFVHGGDTLTRVSETLAADEIGVVLVRDADHGAAGVVSERDIVRVIAEGGDPETTRADEIMSEDVVSIDRGTEIADAARTMLDAGVRHLVVMDGERAFGVVSEREVLRALVAGAS